MPRTRVPRPSFSPRPSPFAGRAGVEALERVVSAAAKKYPGRFGIMDCSLNARSRPGDPPNSPVQQFHDSNLVGLQFLTSTKGFGHHDLGITLAQALDAGIALGAHFIEIYSTDANDPANAPLSQPIPPNCGTGYQGLKVELSN